MELYYFISIHFFLFQLLILLINMENIKVTPVFCDKASHNGKSILGLCLSSSCKENSAFCEKCKDTHTQCEFELKKLEDIPISLMTLR